jgi:sarcosine oxidase subunit beta
LHVYVSQSSRGELVMGASLDPYEIHSSRSTLDFVEGLSSHILDMFPFLSGIKVVRQWAGMADMTPDFSPLMGKTPLEGFYLDAGWGTWGFKATPISGKTMAATLANDKPHELIHAFRLSRFAEFELTGEKGAASVGH